jgi:LPS sulfotransferase NodH
VVKIRGYVICSQARSGSNYVCQLLSSTGQLGRPQDWFNGHGIRARDDPSYPLEPRLQLQQVLARGMTDNGVYGMKMFCESFERIDGMGWASELPDVRWVCLERLDLLGQAISDVRSTQTQQYRSTSPSRVTPRFDHAAIRESLTRIALNHARWKLFFGRNGITPLHLTYESVAASPQSAVDGIANLMDIESAPAIQWNQVSLEVQRDGLSQEWRERFVAGDGDVDRLDPVPSGKGAKVWARWSRLWQGIVE